jgi:glucose/arabinose dehydrogenase
MLLRRCFVTLLLILTALLQCTGAQTRAQWKNTRLTGSPDGPPSYRAVRAWPELSTRPLITAAPEPGGNRILFIEQQAADWSAPMTLKGFTDPAKVETMWEFPGYAYTIAFHPRFAKNRHVFFGVNEPADGGRRHSRSSALHPGRWPA